MNSSIGRRLDRLAVVYRRPLPPAEEAGPPFDATRLNGAERGELDALLALIEPAGRRGRPGFGALDDDELARLDQLNRKACGARQAEPYFAMPHRDPSIGACACLGCDRGPRPNAGDFVGGAP